MSGEQDGRAINQCDYCGEEKPTIPISTRGGTIRVCRDDLDQVPAENRREWPEDCPLVDSGAYNPPKVNYCPSCGGEVKSTVVATQYRCMDSGEVFYVEV